MHTKFTFTTFFWEKFFTSSIFLPPAVWKKLNSILFLLFFHGYLAGCAIYWNIMAHYYVVDVICRNNSDNLRTFLHSRGLLLLFIFFFSIFSIFFLALPLFIICLIFSVFSVFLLLGLIFSFLIFRFLLKKSKEK